MAKHKLTDQVKTFLQLREDNFGLKSASPYLMLEQVIGPMAASLPDAIHREKMEILSGLRRARSALMRVALAGSENENLFGAPVAGDEAIIKSIPKLINKLRDTIDRITGNGEYTSIANSGHVSTSEERTKEFGAFVTSFEQAFSQNRAAGITAA